MFPRMSKKKLETKTLIYLVLALHKSHSTIDFWTPDFKFSETALKSSLDDFNSVGLGIGIWEAANSLTISSRSTHPRCWEKSSPWKSTAFSVLTGTHCYLAVYPTLEFLTYLSGP